MDKAGALHAPGALSILWTMRNTAYITGLALAALALAACSSKETVVVYSAHGSDVLRDYEELFEQAYPEVDLQTITAGAREVFGRIQNERNRPACDVWWGAPSTLYAQAAEAGLLEPYKPAWADQVTAEQHDPQDRWYATYLSPLAILFNKDGLRRDAVPHTWEGLLDPAWRGRIVLREPLASGTMRTFICAMIASAADEDAGLDWLRRFQENVGGMTGSPNLLYDQIKRNPDRISVWLLPDVVMQRERNGFPFDFAVPEPTPVLTDGIAIVKGAPHPEWARRFYEFVTTREALLQQAKAYAKMPARRDIRPEELPAWMTAQPVTPMPLDWSAIAVHEDAWCTRWEREVYRKP